MQRSGIVAFNKSCKRFCIEIVCKVGLNFFTSVLMSWFIDCVDRLVEWQSQSRNWRANIAMSTPVSSQTGKQCTHYGWLFFFSKKQTQINQAWNWDVVILFCLKVNEEHTKIFNMSSQLIWIVFFFVFFSVKRLPFTKDRNENSVRSLLHSINW